MQRKRTREYFSTGTVELGSSLMNASRMRKITMKKLIKWLIIIIVMYILYSIYRKTQMVNTTVDDYDVMYGNNLNSMDDRDLKQDDGKELDGGDRDEMIDGRVKEHINKVFEDFKRKQEEEQRKEDAKDVFQDYRDDIEANGDDANDDDNMEQDDKYDQNEDVGLEDDAAFNVDDDNEIFGDEADEDVVLDGNNDDDFEPVDEEKEKEDIELEKEIEELLADAFEEAADVAKVEAEKVAEKEINEIQNEPAPAVGDKPRHILEPNELKIQKLKVQMDYQHQKEFDETVRKMGNKFRPGQIQHLNQIHLKKALQNDDDHEFPPFVTAVRQTTIERVTQLVASIQQHLPGQKIYVYDLDLTKEQKKEFMSYCGVRVRLFMASVFPKYVRNLDNLHWKPLVMQTALSEFGHITWINPNYKLGTHEVAPLVHESHEQGVLVVGQKASYSTFSATHPDMLKFITTDADKLKNNPHIEIRAIMMHNTDEVHENIMKVFTACALEETCMAPKGAKWQCRFDFTGRSYADCHRYDESALNILLKNWFKYDMNLFARGNNYFRAFDPTYKPKLKRCREARDIKDSEL